MTGQGQAARFGGAAVEDVQQQPLAGLDADGIAMAEHASVDGEGAVADLIAVRVAAGKRSRHRRLAFFFEVGVLPAGQEILGHVAPAAERGLKFLERKEDLLVVGARVLFGFDIYRADQAAVLTAGQVGPRDHVGVIEAEAGRARDKGNAPHAACGDVGRSLFGGAVDVDAHLLAVPV